jgi:hypothetical protein
MSRTKWGSMPGSTRSSKAHDLAIARPRLSPPRPGVPGQSSLCPWRSRADREDNVRLVINPSRSRRLWTGSDSC